MCPQEFARLSDEDLVRGLQAGCDSQEFEERYALLVERLQPRLFCAALRILRDRDEAEEAVSRTWESMLVSLGRYIPERCLVWTWLYAIVRHVCYNTIRKSVNEWDCLIEFRLRAAARDARARALWDQVGRYVEQMPAELRQVLILHWLERKGYEEIARLLGVAVRTVKYRSAHALLWLQQRAPEMREAARF